MRCRVMILMALLVGMTVAGVSQYPREHTGPQGLKLDLKAPFHARSSWQLVVTEGPPVKDAVDGDAPGALTICLHRGLGPCVSGPVSLTDGRKADDPYRWEPHYLKTASIVYPRGRESAPLLLLVAGGLHSANGNQVISTQLITYDEGKDTFRRVFQQSTGRNNNEEVRLLSDGPLSGSVISAIPQERLPFGYWIVVSQPDATGAYRQVLRYASATRYGDGNRLAVIDSEMPNIQKRLGFWKAGEPLPVPDGTSCRKPTLRRDELWCE